MTRTRAKEMRDLLMKSGRFTEGYIWPHIQPRKRTRYAITVLNHFGERRNFFSRPPILEFLNLIPPRKDDHGTGP